MPTVLRVAGFRFYFYSHEPNEPPHVHIDKGSASAKFWLDPPSVARNLGFSAKELSDLLRLVRDNKSELMEAWLGFFGTRR
jgi:hypothetical protein